MFDFGLNDHDITGNLRIDSELEIGIPSSDDDNLCAFSFVEIIAMFSFEPSVKGDLQRKFDPARDWPPTSQKCLLTTNEADDRSDPAKDTQIRSQV